MITNLYGVLLLDGVPHDLTIQPQDTQEEPPVPDDTDLPVTVIAIDGFADLDFGAAHNFEVHAEPDNDLHFSLPRNVRPGKSGVIRVLSQEGKTITFGSGWVPLHGKGLAAEASGLPTFLIAYYAPNTTAVFATVIKVGG